MEADDLTKLSLLQRRNGAVSQTLDLELLSVNKSSNDLLLRYTSLRDILPSTTATADSSAVSVPAPVISIRNRLVKQAACSYLQPATPTPSSNSSFLRRVSSSFFRLLSAVFGSLLRLFPSPRRIFRA
ncbi:Uncharacterized protein Rs2_18558 [Raphanus sativus]|uniref:Uncharacterized protein LOC108852422 n=1 Tax=Raphanus sativus TaxID=3726 RepID=A0A6J0N9M9_RAPSA|nr:uncharacterized protein LOC108852422 [Raphanus sativus]KAJ4904607.1 Uncharacterized protein Rs2_18558 [Raphanus sativus]